jgi:hypothetical protein
VHKCNKSREHKSLRRTKASCVEEREREQRMQARAALASAVLFLLVDIGSCAMYKVGDLDISVCHRLPSPTSTRTESLP